MTTASNTAGNAKPDIQTTAFQILIAISIGHLLNDMIQSLVPSIYPILKQSYDLSFAEIGLYQRVLVNCLGRLSDSLQIIGRHFSAFAIGNQLIG